MKPSLAERTIADFGDQWVVYTNNDGFYGSSAMLQDVFGPLLSIDSFRGAIVADVGAGTGRFANLFVAAGAARIIAIEPSRAFDVLVSNTAAVRERIECVHSDVEHFHPADPVDFAFSFGVLHHIPHPELAVKAMHNCLKPGGRIGVWVYGREGNGVYVTALGVLTLVTRRLPHAMLAALTRVLYVPSLVYMLGSRVLPLPLARYFREVFSKLTPEKRRLTIYDQLNPAYARYYREAEVRRLLESAGFRDVRLFHRHGYSWSAVAVRS
jgi:SAM-dependent methyltransferase